MGGGRGGGYVPGGGGGQSSGRSGANWKPALPGADDEDQSAVYAKRFAEMDRINEIDSMMGFGAFSVGPPRVGWMINMVQTIVKDSEWPGGRSAVDYYFLQEDGEYFKATLVSSPYFFLKCKMGTEGQVEDALRKKFDKTIELIEKVEKEDLDFPNHLSGIQRSYLKLSFRNVSDLDKVKRVVAPIAFKQSESYRDGIVPLTDGRADDNDGSYGQRNRKAGVGGDGLGPALQNIVDIREHDVPFALRVSIDYGISVGLWYTVRVGGGQRTQITVIKDKDVRPDPVILAYDIETSKSPLKFPDSSVDPIMMISYMINGHGFLITNRDIVSQDIEDFEYTPKPDYPGLFTVFNEADEAALLRRFFAHIQQVRPTVIVTYNGDFFDFPYVEARALVHGMDMEAMIGFKKNSQGDYWATHSLHLDCFRWVKRDSYLPAGSQGLKAVTSAKLGYDPLELDPELMTPLAGSDPQTLANYSVSDAVATFYLYMKYVHPFIFSLCNIIPLNPDDVLRKGTGTLCETLLMAEAFRANVIMPNKHLDGKESFHNGHLIESETYIGGHVEALEAGVFRADIPYRFRLDPKCLQELIDDLDRALTFSLRAEGGVSDMSTVENYDEIKAEIKGRLEMLKDSPQRHDQPLIYHLDVASMYPNIILTNRLQPTAMVEESTCAQCDHNRPGKTCQRRMSWWWRGELYTAKRNEYRMIKAQLESEQFPRAEKPSNFAPKGPSAAPSMVPYHALPEAEQKTLLHKRLAEYSQKAYRRVRKTETVQKESIVCQKEHAFYIDTVRAFRDRRYDYKDLHKKAKKWLDEAHAAKDAIRTEECKKLVVLYESLQLAHKCILNSFYGYVMRKGARWYSMEMAGIVCATGSAIIQLARQLVERIGRPLELDTDGIWAMLPWDFPQAYTFKLAGGRSHAFDYPCVMLNHLVHDRFTNDQYQTLSDPASRTYAQSSENSIFFEIDGPYRAMIIPSSTEEGKLLKKRYAVFNHNGSLAELKGFEVKRRGELKFLKVFQTQIFKVYLEGATLAECYAAVARVADHWLDILHGHGSMLEEHELVDLVAENRSMSKSLEEYGEQKSTSISTARRLAEFLGDAMVKDRGLACKFVISAKPAGIPVAQRAIPLAIFAAEEPVKRHYLRKWLRDPGMTDFDIRSIIDWDYYLERLGSMVQKLIVIPAALQGVSNPVSRVPQPDWLLKGHTGSGQDAAMQQLRITDAFKPRAKGADIEDLLSKPTTQLIDEKGKKDDAVDGDEEEMQETSAEQPEAALMETDYASWLSLSKAHWRHLRATLPTRMTQRKPQAPSNAFGRLAEHDKDLVTRSPWQLISLQETGPGEFTAWALLRGGGPARSFKLNALRTLYLHLACPLSELEDSAQLESMLERVHHRLPDGSPAQWLYAFPIPEAVFQAQMYRFAAITMLPQLLGMYEAEVPLSTQLLVSLGSCVTVKPEMRKLRDAHSRFSPDDLAFCSTGEVPYLANPEALRWILVLQYTAADGRQLVLLGLPQEGGLVRYRLLIVEAGMRRQLPSSLRSLVPPPPSEKDISAASVDIFSLDADRCTLEADLFPEAGALQRALTRSVQEAASSHPGPFVVLSNATSLSLDLPVVPVPANEASLPFPALDWQRAMSRRALGSVAGLGTWLADRLALARYAHLPIGNLALDQDAAYAQVADVFYARALRRSGHLLWKHCPEQSGQSLVEREEREEGPPTQRTAGLFRTVCVEAELSGLAINALMEHASIAAEDSTGGGGRLVTGPEGEVSLAGTAAPGTALLTILRRLLAAWLRETLQHGNQHAERLAAQIHAWICQRSALHSRVLARRLRSLMNRSLGLLVARLHSFGCEVVDVDPTGRRLVLRTARTERAAAFALLDWIQRELKKLDAFGWIDFVPVRYWKRLVWMDSGNWHGLAYTAAADEEVGQENETTWLMNWSLADYLPVALQALFKRLIQEYLAVVADPKTASEAEDNSPAASLKRLSLIPSEMNLDPAEDVADDLEAAEIDTAAFSQLFLRVLREAQRFLFSAPTSDEDVAARCFPDLLGSRLAATHGTRSPVPRAALLEFVKACGAVFSLDSQCPRRSEHLMKLAFSLLGLPPFADEAVWRQPVLAMALGGSELLCPACMNPAHLDICRDLARADGRAPLCTACAQPIPLPALESALLTSLATELEAYLAQDLVCAKCSSGTGIKADAMQPICLRCASGFRLAGTIKPEDLAERAAILRRLAPAYNMQALTSFLANIPL